MRMHIIVLVRDPLRMRIPRMCTLASERERMVGCEVNRSHFVRLVVQIMLIMYKNKCISLIHQVVSGNQSSQYFLAGNGVCSRVHTDRVGV